MTTDQKLDKIAETLVRIQLTQIKQEENLREHMRRTAVAEKSLDQLKRVVELTEQKLEKRIAPIQKHVDQMKFIFWLATVVGGAALGAVQLVAYFNK